MDAPEGGARENTPPAKICEGMMGKHKDVKTIRQPPALMRYREGESWQDRHARRLRTALQCETVLRNWLELHAIMLEVEREGAYWRMSRGNKLAEWWPASASLVLGRGYDQPIHVHDYTKVIECLRSHWKLPGINFIDGRYGKGVRS